MAFNPTSQVAAARDYGEKFKYDQVIIIGIVGDKVGYASYGKTKDLCAKAKVIADKIFKALGVSTIALLLCFGCATPPSRPNGVAMMDAIMNHGMKADQVNQIYADYDKARAEHEQTASYKSIPYLVAPLLLVGGALGDMPYYGCRGSGYARGCLPSKAIVNTTPTAGGGTSSRIKWYR